MGCTSRLPSESTPMAKIDEALELLFAIVLAAVGMMLFLMLMIECFK